MHRGYLTPSLHWCGRLKRTGRNPVSPNGTRRFKSSPVYQSASVCELEQAVLEQVFESSNLSAGTTLLYKYGASGDVIPHLCSTFRHRTPTI